MAELVAVSPFSRAGQHALGVALLGDASVADLVAAGVSGRVAAYGPAPVASPTWSRVSRSRVAGLVEHSQVARDGQVPDPGRERRAGPLTHDVPSGVDGRPIADDPSLGLGRQVVAVNRLHAIEPDAGLGYRARTNVGGGVPGPCTVVLPPLEALVARGASPWYIRRPHPAPSGPVHAGNHARRQSR